MGNSDLDGMGGAIALMFGVIVVIWALLKDSDRKIKANAQNAVTAQQQAATSQFKREFGTNQQFDSSDFYIANRVVDYAKAGGDKLETIANVAGLFGTVKSVIARESSQATAKLVKEQIEQNRQNRDMIPPQNQLPQQPIFIEKPQEPRRIYVEQPPPNRRYYDDNVEYIPRPKRGYNHYEY